MIRPHCLRIRPLLTELNLGFTKLLQTDRSLLNKHISLAWGVTSDTADLGNILFLKYLTIKKN